jgi:hypothetical protein
VENLARQKLSELYLKYGADLHQDSRKCEGLLRDTCGNLKLEIHVLIEALQRRGRCGPAKTSIRYPS